MDTYYNLSGIVDGNIMYPIPDTNSGYPSRYGYVGDQTSEFSING